MGTEGLGNWLGLVWQLKVEFNEFGVITNWVCILSFAKPVLQRYGDDRIDFAIIQTGDSHVLTSDYAEDASVKVHNSLPSLILGLLTGSWHPFQDDVVAYYDDVVNSLYTTQVGTAVNISFEEECTFSECTIGDLLADDILQATGAGIGIINSGSIGYVDKTPLSGT